MDLVKGRERTRLDITFSALSNPIRRQMISRLAAGDKTVAKLAEPFEVTRPAI